MGEKYTETHEVQPSPEIIESKRNDINSGNYIVCDLETDTSTNTHVVNHAQVDRLHVNDSYDYDKCLREQRSFDGYNSLDEFCDWLFTEKSHSHSTVLAHNGVGYDFRFILKWCLDHGLHPDVFIRQGNIILYMWFRKKSIEICRYIAILPATIGRPFNDLCYRHYKRSFPTSFQYN